MMRDGPMNSAGCALVRPGDCSMDILRLLAARIPEDAAVVAGLRLVMSWQNPSNHPLVVQGECGPVGSMR
ncbi:hypothetical protein Ntsu_25050 [Nocardia sp. IFM 10818]